MASTNDYFWSKTEDGWTELYTSRNGLTLLICRTPYSENAKLIAVALTIRDRDIAFKDAGQQAEANAEAA